MDGFLPPMTLGTVMEVVGYLGTLLTVGAYAVSTMIPLRVMAILSSVAFLTYGLYNASVPIVLTELALLPLNVYHLHRMIRLTKRAERAAATDLSMDWVKPYATLRRVSAGERLFAKGETAQEMFVIETGRLRLAERGIELGPGQVVGELGFLSPGNLRTLSLDCVEDATLLRVSYHDLRQLYFQNPEFGFYFLKLVSARQFENAAAGEPGAPSPVAG